MTIRKYSERGLLCALALGALTGCGSLNSALEGDKINYKSAGKAPTLEIPPDLTQLQRDNRYAIPDGNRGVATASGYNLMRSARDENTNAPAAVAPVSSTDARIERSGNQRWLVVKQSPEALWPQIKDFWQDSGFLINVESPQTGVLETDWAENRAKIPQDFLRNALGKVLDSLYSTGERDKFRTRLERIADGGTEIYISHRGMQETLVGREGESTVWTPRASDPELEAEFLASLLSRFGTETARAKVEVANAPLQQARAHVVKADGNSHVEVGESFDRAWRRVGLALDRVGFTVEDRDRNQGLYFVRYVNPEQDAETSKKGFLSKLFDFSKAENVKNTDRYQVAVQGSGDATKVSVLDIDGKPSASKTADRILALLNEQLK